MTPWYRSDTVQARLVLDEALGLLESVPDDDTPFFDHVTFGLCPLPEGPGGEVRLYFEETIFLFHRFRRAQAAAYALNNVAWTARAVGDADGARAALEDALAQFRAIEDASGEALTLNHMGNLARSQGDIESGREHLGAALELRRTLGEKRGITISIMCLGMLEVGAGELERGRELMAEALSRAEAVDDFPAMAGVQTNWGLVEERRGDLERAARLLEDGRALWHVQLLRRFEGWAAIALADIHTALGDEAGAQRALDAAGTVLAGSQDRAAMRYLNAKRALSGCKDAGS
jgi:tetratricopeptide (TPR) repeat protein